MTGSLRRWPALLVVCLAAAPAACGGRSGNAGAGDLATIYNAETGKLEQMVSDRDGDGKAETRAFMDGAVLKRIEIDRTGDGQPDRWEYYSGGQLVRGAASGATANIDHAEEANGPDRRITRREFFANGLIRRVVDDTDFDGRPDKWEAYENGFLVSVELDLLGKGFASQRLVYAPDGSVTRVETDPEGDGVFVPVVKGGQED